MSKKDLANEKVFLARMVSDFSLYTAQQVHDLGLEKEEYVTTDKSFSLKYVSPYERKGRKDSVSDGSDKPRVHVRAFFKKKLSLKDHRELFGINEALKANEHKIHTYESEWHKSWKDRVEDFCELEKRFYPNNIPTKEGYKTADAYYLQANTAIEFQKSFDDEALTKSVFYAKEHIKLIWLFYLPTLSVFEDDGVYKIREDNFYHFFRIEEKMPDFYSNNIVFIQDKNNRIYNIKKLERVNSNVELEGTVRFFGKCLTFNTSNEFANWLHYDWVKSDLYGNDSIKLDSIENILMEFRDKPDKMFHLQNCEKKDKNGHYLIYCFVKDNGIIRKNSMGIIGYRDFIRYDGKYEVNKNWDETTHNPTIKKWRLLATNVKKYNDIFIIDDSK